MALTIDFTGRWYLLCGVANGGIGGATARVLAEAGAQIMAVDFGQDIIDQTISEIERAGGRADGIVADLTDADQSDRIVPEMIRRVGRVDGVINVAGGTRADEWMPLERTPTASFRQTLNLNLEYVFRICRDAANAMIDGGISGSLINVSSISGLASAPHHGPYGAAKAGIAALTRTMAFEWARYGIRANSVAPGAVLTKRVIDRGAVEDQPGVAWTLPEELANAIAFLLSDMASGISGQNLVVDSGLSTRFCGSMEPLELRKSNV
jgi:NAD(P)-dependent dehydrogenase (short-subunit alcohol dehydrogenase family)